MKKIQTLAASFESFINGLKVDEPIDWVDYVLNEASHLDEKIKMSVAAEVTLPVFPNRISGFFYAYNHQFSH